MVNFPKKLQNKLAERASNNALRTLDLPTNLIDFSSNDYLGFASNEVIFKQVSNLLFLRNIHQNGASGSRLITGNSHLYEEVEQQIVSFHQVKTALLFNSGYDANIGFFSAVPQRGDVILYDEFIHASIRDGIRMSDARAYKFKHNNLDDLKAVIQRNLVTSTPLSHQEESRSEVYIVTESVFSMDGDTPDLTALANFCTLNSYNLVVDEAHAVGVFGLEGQGLVFDLALQNKIFAHIITFGKALGCHGAAILGGQELRNYLVNFARSFIYTTGLPPHTIATISAAYMELKATNSRNSLHQNIAIFNEQIKTLGLDSIFIPSISAIHCCIISGNENVKKVASRLQNEGFSVKPILSPTVPKGQERLRFCLHNYNKKEEITKVLSTLEQLSHANES